MADTFVVRVSVPWLDVQEDLVVVLSAAAGTRNGQAVRGRYAQRVVGLLDDFHRRLAKEFGDSDSSDSEEVDEAEFPVPTYRSEPDPARPCAIVTAYRWSAPGYASEGGQPQGSRIAGSAAGLTKSLQKRFATTRDPRVEGLSLPALNTNFSVTKDGDDEGAAPMWKSSPHSDTSRSGDFPELSPSTSEHPGSGDAEVSPAPPNEGRETSFSRRQSGRAMLARKDKRRFMSQDSEVEGDILQLRIGTPAAGEECSEPSSPPSPGAARASATGLPRRRQSWLESPQIVAAGAGAGAGAGASSAAAFEARLTSPGLASPRLAPDAATNDQDGDSGSSPLAPVGALPEKGGAGQIVGAPGDRSAPGKLHRRLSGDGGAIGAVALCAVRKEHASGQLRVGQAPTLSSEIGIAIPLPKGKVHFQRNRTCLATADAPTITITGAPAAPGGKPDFLHTIENRGASKSLTPSRTSTTYASEGDGSTSFVSDINESEGHSTM